VVNTEPITNNEVRARVARALREMGERGMVPPPAASLRQQMLERLISERAQLQYARELGLSVDDATLAQAELSIARQNHLATVPELHQRIEQEGISVKDFQADVRNQVLLSRLREREIEPRIRVSDADVDAYIREQTGARTAVPELNLAMILVEVPEHASADDVARLQKRADEAAEKARAGEDFAKLAAEYSTPTTAAATAACWACTRWTNTPSCSSRAPRARPWAASSGRCARRPAFTC
jgi:peptidyl-prolyl cis-trans isomerase SurA